jgi:hypothetical protein
MHIQLKQPELIVAVKDYIIRMGINRPVGEVTFTAARSNGGQISTEVEIAETAVLLAVEAKVSKMNPPVADVETVPSVVTSTETEAEPKDAEESVGEEEEGEESTVGKKSLFS